MLIEKLSGGVLRMLTPLGPRYIQPSFLQRVYLLWMFRNFQTLPFQVLTQGQRKLIDRLCTQQRFVSPTQINSLFDVPILGTLEQRPAVEFESQPPRRPSGRADAVPFAADIQQRS